jgi:polyhydroxyalkanoate synthesis regulator phasin
MRTQKTIAAAAMTAALAGGALIGSTLGNPLASGAEPGAAATTTTTAAGDSGTSTEQGGPGRGFGRGGFDLEVAATTLELTTEELRTQLKAGKTLAEIAEAQGVDKQTLIDALVEAGEARLDEAKAALPDQVAKVVDGTLPAGGFGEGHGPGGRGGFGRGASLEVAAEALGVTEADLRTALEDGKTIAEVAADKGVDKQKVIDALVADAKARSAEAVEEGTITQEQADERLADVTERITSFVDEGRPQGGPGDHKPGD